MHCRHHPVLKVCQTETDAAHKMTTALGVPAADMAEAGTEANRAIQIGVERLSRIGDERARFRLKDREAVRREETSMMTPEETGRRFAGVTAVRLGGNDSGGVRRKKSQKAGRVCVKDTREQLLPGVDFK